MHSFTSALSLLSLFSLPFSFAMPANPPAPAPIIGDAGILSPAEWQELEVLVDRPFHFETDPRNPYHNTNNNRRDAPDAATASPLSGSSTIDAKSCTADPRIDKVKLIADELANVKQVLQKAASMQETHPVWGNLTSVANVRDDDPNPLQRTKDLFAAALAIIDDPNSPLQLKYTCESDPKICLHAPSLDGTTNASVTSYFDASTNTVKFCDAFFALYPQTAAECSNDTSLSSSLQTRTGTILHELFHAIGSAAKPSKDRTREVFDLISYDYTNVASLARGECKNPNYPTLTCDPNFTLVNIDTLKWVANGYYWYETCKAQDVSVALA